MAQLWLYRLRYRDPVTGRWKRARYRALPIGIRMRYPDHELLDVEVREVSDRGEGYFNPCRQPDP